MALFDRKPHGTRHWSAVALLQLGGVRLALQNNPPRFRIALSAGGPARRSFLPVKSPEVGAASGSTEFDTIEVTSEAVLALNQTLRRGMTRPCLGAGKYEPDDRVSHQD